jgi:hypothetical protein
MCDSSRCDSCRRENVSLTLQDDNWTWLCDRCDYERNKDK